MIEDLWKVSNTVKFSNELVRRTETIYQFLLNHKGQHFRAKEIAENCNLSYGAWLGFKGTPTPQRATKPLQYLMELNLVSKIIVEDEPIEIEVETKVQYPKDDKPLKVIVDGIEYIRVNDYQHYDYRWEMVKKTITPHHSEYFVN